jgi:signal transduction histidine kinase
LSDSASTAAVSERHAAAAAGEERARLARLLDAIGRTIMVGAALPILHNAWIGNRGSALALVAAEVGVATALLLNRRGRRTAAIRVMVGTLQVCAAGLVALGGQGFHDIAIMIFPATLVVAGLLLDTRAFAWTTAATVLFVVSVGLGEALGLWVNPLSRYTNVRNLLDAAIVLTVTAVAVGLLASSLKASLVRARENELRLADANAELVERARQLAASESELRQAQKMEAVGRLAGGIAHDFNNVLMVVRASAALARRDVDEATRAGRCLAEIEQAAERAAALTRQLLAFGRRHEGTPRRVDLGRLVADLRPMLTRIVGDAVEVEIRPRAGAACVEIDPVRAEQALLNLAMNARDAMPAGGRLSLTVARQDLDVEGARALALPAGPYVALTVEDTGCGMPEDVRERVFEPFFTTKEHGTGLGLSMVYSAVKQAGGAIRLDSAPGRGSTFSILLPQAPSTMAG